MHTSRQAAGKSPSPRRRRPSPCCWIFLLALASLRLPLAAQQVASTDVEAAYLYNLGKFVEWPSQPPSPRFSICLLGKDEFGKTIDTLVANEAIDGRNIVVNRLSSLAAADSCQIVYIGLSEQSRLRKDLDALKGKPILTVSSLPGFLDRGGMVQFLIQQNKVRFAINLSAANRAHLTLSSELLKVAVYVNTPSQEGNE